MENMKNSSNIYFLIIQVYLKSKENLVFTN